MEEGSIDLTPSGIEPIDRLIGGLHKGKLHLAYGDGFAKSLLGLRFLIEGLRLGESAALVTDYSPEDAVRRFAHLGYDCLEHIYTGRLIVLECGDDNVKQIARMSDLNPVLKELRWLMGESAPGRIVFEPIARLIVSDQFDLSTRVRQFATWSADIGSTVLLVSGPARDGEALVRELQPYLDGSFELSTVDQSDHTTGSIRFDKPPNIGAVAINVDRSEGIFLQHRDQSIVANGKSQDQATLDYSTPMVPAVQPATERPLGPFDDLLSELAALDETASSAPGQENHKQEGSGTSETNAGAEKRSRTAQSESSLRELELDSNRDDPGAAASEGPQEWPGRGTGGVSAPRPLGVQRTNAPVITRITADELLRPPAEGRPAINTSESTTRADAGRLENAEARRQSRRGTTRAADAPKHGDLNVLVVTTDPASQKRIAKALKDYSLQLAEDGVSGLAKLISFRPDLVVLDVDLQVLDGFKILEHIRSNLDVPIIILSSSYLRASDRIQWTELGADYYLAKPFSVTELRHKARQLIARYRGIEEWITGAPALAGAGPRRGSGRRGLDHALAGIPERARSHQKQIDNCEPSRPAPQDLESDSSRPEHRDTNRGPACGENGHYVPYAEFVRRVEERVGRAAGDESWFCIVGCRTSQNGDDPAREDHQLLFGLISALVRQGDILSVNDSNDIMIMLDDADAAGAKAFTSRLRSRLVETLSREPIIWLRQFPVPDPS